MAPKGLKDKYRKTSNSRTAISKISSKTPLFQYQHQDKALRLLQGTCSHELCCCYTQCRQIDIVVLIEAQLIYQLFGHHCRGLWSLVL